MVPAHLMAGGLAGQGQPQLPDDFEASLTL